MGAISGSPSLGQDRSRPLPQSGRAGSFSCSPASRSAIVGNSSCRLSCDWMRPGPRTAKRLRVDRDSGRGAGCRCRARLGTIPDRRDFNDKFLQPTNDLSDGQALADRFALPIIASRAISSVAVRDESALVIGVASRPSANSARAGWYWWLTASSVHRRPAVQPQVPPVRRPAVDPGLP